MKLLSAAVAFSALAPLVASIDLDTNDDASIRKACSTYAKKLMSYYTGNQPSTPQDMRGCFPNPYYWWEAGAAWGGMVEYAAFTKDTAYNDIVVDAHESNFGPDNNILLPWKKAQTGNDDQAYWAIGMMSTLEYGFTSPKNSSVQYIDVVKNAFDNIASRWDPDHTCGGGLKWQVYPERAKDGYYYKNSVSNGAFFNLAARLAMYTGNKTYVDWAQKTWDWSRKVGLVSDKFEVFDGADEQKNCDSIDHTEWSYNVGIYMHGAAAMYSLNKGSDEWQKIVSGFVDHASIFFKPFDNATDVMFEPACETGANGRKCNLDQQSFKAYLSRFMAKTAVLAPFAKDKISNYLTKSAQAAAKSCSGGQDSTCGSKWYTGAWDGTDGVGQQLSALEVTQALLTLKNNITPRNQGAAQQSSSPVASSSSPSSTAAAAASSAASIVQPSSVASAAPSAASSSAANVASSSVVTATAPGNFAPSPGSDSINAASSAPSSAGYAASQIQPISQIGDGQLQAPVPTSGYAAPSAPAGSSAPAGASTVAPVAPSAATSAAPIPASSGGQQCGIWKTVTVTVPPPAATPTPVVPAPPYTTGTTGSNGTLPIGNGTTTGPGVPAFTGAAMDVKSATLPVLGAALFAVAAVLF